jgi:hypothetical protein
LAGAFAAGFAVAAGRDVVLRTLPAPGDDFVDKIASHKAVIMNNDAAIVVAFERTVAVPRGPNTV